MDDKIQHKGYKLTALPLITITYANKKASNIELDASSILYNLKPTRNLAS